MIHLLTMRHYELALLSILMYIVLILQIIVVLYEFNKITRVSISKYYNVLLLLFLVYETWTAQINSSLLFKQFYFTYHDDISIEIAMLIITLYVVIISKNYRRLNIMVAIILFLPISDNHFVAVGCIVAAYTILGLYTLKSAVTEYKFTGNQITNLSIRDAFNQLDDGLIFTNKNSESLFVNNAMKKILDDIGIENTSDIHKMWDSINKKISQTLDVDMFIIDGAENSYLIKRKRILNDNTYYYEISAKDITDESTLVKNLDIENKKLSLANDHLKSELKIALDNEIKNVILESKILLHDTISQRISAVHYFLNDMSLKKKDDIVFLKESILSLSDDFNGTSYVSSKDVLNFITKTLKSIDVKFSIKGNLFENKHINMIMMSCLRELCTNAVKHAISNEISVEFYENEVEQVMRVTNDGNMPEGNIIYGNGLKGISHRLSKENGILRIAYDDKFIATITINKKKPDPKYLQL